MENEEIIEINDCDCGCGCADVELVSEKEPDVILFDEYAEPYENEIIRTREAAEQTLELVTEKSGVIESKVDLILDDTATIKRELGRGVSQIRADIADSKSTTVAGVAAIREDIANIRIDLTLEECTVEEVHEMFNENNTNSNQ